MYIKDDNCGCMEGNVSHIALDGLTCNRFEMAEFTKQCMDINVNFIGICCGADPHHVREMAVAMGRKPIAYKYYPDMTKHFAHGNEKSLKDHNKVQEWLK
jgi:betaine-homocysteine S-methyltransferase